MLGSGGGTGNAIRAGGAFVVVFVKNNFKGLDEFAEKLKKFGEGFMKVGAWPAWKWFGKRGTPDGSKSGRSFPLTWNGPLRNGFSPLRIYSSASWRGPFKRLCTARTRKRRRRYSESLASSTKNLINKLRDLALKNKEEDKMLDQFSPETQKRIDQVSARLPTRVGEVQEAADRVERHPNEKGMKPPDFSIPGGVKTAFRISQDTRGQYGIGNRPERRPGALADRGGRMPPLEIGRARKRKIPNVSTRTET
jgi:hypothetical protein